MTGIGVDVPSTGAAGNGVFVQSLARGLAVIRSLTGERSLPLPEIARRSSLDRATARRFVLTLEQLGYLAGDGKEYALTPRVLSLGYAPMAGSSLAAVAAPYLAELVADIGEPASVAVLDRDEVAYVARVQVRTLRTMDIGVGTRLPAYATSLGRVLLAALPPEELTGYLDRVERVPLTGRTLTAREQLVAELDRVRRAGWSLVDGELEDGVRSIAVPLTDATGRTVAAANVSSHVQERSVDDLPAQLLPPLRAAAARIERDLRSGRPPARG
jgi:IclR family pca regulon transcriptional regulator